MWIGAEVFIMSNITIHEGAVVGARSGVFKNVSAWSIIGGNPAKYIKDRIIENE